MESTNFIGDDIDYVKTFSAFGKPVVVKGVNGNIVFMNESAKNLSKSAQGDIFASYDEKLPEDVEQINKLGIISIEKKLQVKTQPPQSGSKLKEMFFHIESFTLLNKFGLFSGTIFIFYDITQFADFSLKNLGNSAEDNKAFDEITGFLLKNRFQDIYSMEIERATRYGMPLSVVSFFFQNLAFIGQSFGKDKLDQLLKFYGINFKQKFRKTDILFRMDFNNFMAIMPHTNYKEGENKFNRVQSWIKDAVKLNVETKPFLIFGIAEFDLKRHYKNKELLLKEAEAALPGYSYNSP